MPTAPWRHAANGGIFMHENICGLSAFQLYRVPPQVLEMFPLFPDIAYRSGKLQLLHYPLNHLHIDLPLQTLVTQRKHLRYRESVTTKLWTGELPPGAFCENALGITLTSPLYTLSTMAPQVSEIQLLMAMYEFCGSFAIFSPTPEIQQEVERLPVSHDWEQVRDVEGRPTSLWRRRPLVEPEELVQFARTTSGIRGHKKLLRAAHYVRGAAASPLEAQTAILFALSRRLGGEELPPFSINHRITLSPQARTIANQNTCFADIFFEQTDKHPALDIECHGHMAHDESVKGGLDANRALALQSMGIEVVFLTHEQICDTARFYAVVQHIASILGACRPPKTELMRHREINVRRELFCDWELLGHRLPHAA